MQNDTIRALNHREQAREKLPVFYGSRDNFLHGFKEVLNNAVDEILNNFPNGEIDITLHDDLQTITISDTGRGLPIADTDDNNIPYYELLFTTLFAGGKFEETDRIDSGVNGVGMCVLNYTSSIFQVHSCNKGKKYYIDYINGGQLNTPLTFVENTEYHGTTITFKLDESIYTNTVYTYEKIREIIDKTTMVSPNITIKLSYQGNEEIFHYNSIEDYFINHCSANIIEPFAFNNRIYEEKDGEKTQVEIVFSCSAEDILLQECMLNGNSLIEKSTIYDGVINGVKTFVTKYCKENNLYEKKEKPISNNDVEGAITFCCKLMSNRVEFQSQTKFSTQKKLYKEVVQKYIQEMLEVYSIERKDDFQRMVNQILICKRAYEKSAKTIQATKKKLSEKVDGLCGRVEGLVDCTYHDERSEIFISEGKSAMGSVIASRNPKIQAGYAIRGKILSCLKASYETIFANAVVVDLIKILGCGVEVKSKHNKELDSFNIDNLRYGKIVINTDSDFDGENIQVLLLTMIYRLMPQLLLQGKVYISQTPKYVIKNKDSKYYAFTDDEKDDIISKLQGKTTINYLKGLAELDAIDMSNTALNPDTRKMIKVTINDVEEMIRQFEVWMDDDVTQRKEFIQNHLHEYISDEE